MTNTDNVIQETCDLRTELRATDTRATIILSDLHANLYPHRDTMQGKESDCSPPFPLAFSLRYDILKSQSTFNR